MPIPKVHLHGKGYHSLEAEMEKIYGWEAVYEIKKQIKQISQPKDSLDIAELYLISIFDCILSLHRAVEIYRKWENNNSPILVAEFEDAKACIIHYVSKLEEQDQSVFELLTSAAPIFREVSTIYTKIQSKG